MLPGVELARKRKIHHHEVAVAGPSDSSARTRPSSQRPPVSTGMAKPALLARLRLEEKLQGLAIGSYRRNLSSSPSSLSPPTSMSPPWPTSRQNGHARRGGGSPRVQAAPTEPNLEGTNRSNTVYTTTAATEPVSMPAVQASSVHKTNSISSLLRSNSGIQVCAVCLEEVQGSKQRIVWLPCSHKYHSDCVLPWLAARSHCPCCRAQVSPMSVLSR